MKSKGFGKYSDTFHAEKVSGRRLLSLNRRDLQHLGLKSRHVSRLLKYVAKLKRAVKKPKNSDSNLNTIRFPYQDAQAPRSREPSDESFRDSSAMSTSSSGSRRSLNRMEI